MNKFILLPLFFSIFSIVCYGSDVDYDYTKNKFGIGLKIGGGGSMFNTPLTDMGTSLANVSFNGGVAFHIPITKYRFSIQSEITYNWRAFKDENWNSSEHGYRISTVEFPIMLNTRLFEYESNRGRFATNLITGIGFSRGLDSKIIHHIDDGTITYNQYGTTFGSDETSDFVDVRRNNYLFIAGINIRLLDDYHTTLGLRYTQYLKSIYAYDKIIEEYDFTVKAFCISLDLSVYF